ncbi:MAG TPA: hypothetical protein VL500_02665 [Candidatus Eisenbacteria bacterium]|nr:hypothetical protein [Candidatus Eisenbacteria bacterium]
MRIHLLMVLALIATFAIPPIFGWTGGAMIASHLCILIVTLTLFFGTLNLNKKPGQK